MILVAATIGVRDVRYRHSNSSRFLLGNPRGGDYVAVAGQLWCTPKPDQENLRSIALELRMLYCNQQLTGSLEIPILRPGLDHAIQQCGTIDQVVLIVTDQPQGVHHRIHDTIHCGELIAKLLNKDPRIRHVDLFQISYSPHQADKVYPMIRDRLTTVGQVNRFFALKSAGTPAISDSLHHAGMNVFGDRCTAVTVAEPRSDHSGATLGTARELDPAPFLKDAIRVGARALIEHGNYAGAMDVLNNFGAKHWEASLLALLRHATARVNLARGQARRAADQVRASLTVPPCTHGCPCLDRCLEIPSGDFAVLGFTNEVRFLIEAALRQERYADALFRTALFVESCQAIHAVGVLVHDPTLFKTTLHHILTGRINLDQAQNAGIDNVLDKAYGPIPGGGQWDTGDKRRLFNHVAGLNLKPNFRQAFDLINWGPFTGLRRLRNQTIHAPNGVSKGAFQNVIELNHLVCRLGEIMIALYECFDMEPAADPYPVLQREMLDLLNR